MNGNYSDFATSPETVNSVISAGHQHLEVRQRIATSAHLRHILQTTLRPILQHFYKDALSDKHHQIRRDYIPWSPDRNILHSYHHNPPIPRPATLCFSCRTHTRHDPDTIDTTYPHPGLHLFAVTHHSFHARFPTGPPPLPSLDSIGFIPRWTGRGILVQRTVPIPEPECSI